MAPRSSQWLLVVNRAALAELSPWAAALSLSLSLLVRERAQRASELVRGLVVDDPQGGCSLLLPGPPSRL